MINFTARSLLRPCLLAQAQALARILEHRIDFHDHIFMGFVNIKFFGSYKCRSKHIFLGTFTTAALGHGLSKKWRDQPQPQNIKVSCLDSGDIFFRTAMITRHVQNGRIEDARYVFDKMSERNVVTWNAMIAGYAKNGLIEEARELFDKMPERNVVSWTAIVTGYAQIGRIEDARQVFDRMPCRNVVSWNAMIAGYCRSKRIGEASEFFNKMPERNVVSWTTIITGYAQNGKLENACQLFDKMPERDVASWNAMIAGYVQNGRIENARQLFDKMPERNVVSWTTIIAGYVQTGKLEDAQNLFDHMPERNVVAWTAMIAGYAQNSHGEKALQLISQMQRAGMKPNEATLTSVISACASLATLEQGKQIHAHVLKRKYDLDIFVGSALVSMYSKCGTIDIACHVFEKMPERSVVSWNAMISGYAQHGSGKEALQLFEQMQRASVKPDQITFIGVLSACSHAGLADEGRRYFDSMNRDHFITPMADHYACMVDLLGRAGCLDEAESFIHKMPFEPDAVVWGSLLNACRIHANVELGTRTAERLFELEPQNDSTYLLLSNIYAAAGRWDNVAKLRMMMKGSGVKKEPGCSWIEVENNMHTFLMGDRSHPQRDQIYATLERLTGQMKEAGYVPDINFVLHDI